MRTRLRYAALGAALAVCLALGLSACGGSSNGGKPIPASDAQALQRQLSSIESRFNAGGGACNDIFQGSDPNEAPVDSTISSLPAGTDSDVRQAVSRSFDRLFQLVRDQCKKPAPTPTTSTTETPTRTTPPPTTSTSPTTETTPTTQTTTQPKKPKPNNGNGNRTGNGNGNSRGGSGGGGGRGGEGSGGGSGRNGGGGGGGESGARDGGTGDGALGGDGGTTTPQGTG